MIRFIVSIFKVAAFVLSIGLLMIGVLIVFGSFFFEETRSQLQFIHVLRNIGIFFGGCTTIAIGGALFKLSL